MWSIDKVLPLTARRWVYGVATAVIPLLIAYGIVDEQTAPLWVALVAAVLVPGLAAAGTVPAKGQTAVVDESEAPGATAADGGPEAVVDVSEIGEDTPRHGLPDTGDDELPESDGER